MKYHVPFIVFDGKSKRILIEASHDIRCALFQTQVDYEHFRFPVSSEHSFIVIRSLYLLETAYLRKHLASNRGISWKFVNRLTIIDR